MRAPVHRAAQGWGLRRPRRARADPGGVAPAGDDEGARRAASRAQCSRAGSSTAEQSWRCSSCGRRGGRGGRVAAGGGGGGGEREPDPLPDLTPSSARVSGGRAGEPRGLSGNVVCGRREAEGAGVDAEHCGSSSPSSASEAHKGRLADSSPHRAPRRLPGLWGRCLRDQRLPERGRNACWWLSFNTVEFVWIIPSSNFLTFTLPSPGEEKEVIIPSLVSTFSSFTTV
ncbi:uncharacterized protein LOC116567168 [Mustela erminea]|uniref:uncharacterized protein LOC116567168 n=1 Tax=Mustela erminea TaxID=36723 RepID=UPI001386C5FD|nr:uncharacterized protein LOC116567168 [Mustela erminea]